MFFSDTHWPQLTAPFYSILFETSIWQFNSYTFSPIMPDEVREHLTRDQRPFLHPESLQTLYIPRSMMVLLLFSSLHSFSTGFMLEDWNGYSRSLVLWSVTRACERSGAWSERGAECAKYSRSAERVFIQRLERSLCLAPVPLRYRSHHEPRACTNPPRIHLCLQQLTKPSAYSLLQKSFVVKERWSSLNISKS